MQFHAIALIHVWHYMVTITWIVFESNILESLRGSVPRLMSHNKHFCLICRFQMTPFSVMIKTVLSQNCKTILIRKTLWALSIYILWNVVTQPDECKPVGLFHIMLTMDISQRPQRYINRQSYLIQKPVDIYYHITCIKLLV